MEALRSVERRIEEGFVLSDQGRWMHMAELRIYEKRVIEQLANGNVLVDGAWIHIEEAKRHARAARAAQAMAFESTQNMLETVCISMPMMKSSGDDAGANRVNIKPDTAIAAIDFSGRDDIRETAFLTIERSKPQPQVAQAVPASVPVKPVPEKPVPEKSVPEKPAKVAAVADVPIVNAPAADKRDLAAEIDGVLLLGLSRSAAAEQSKYAMEYIEEFNYTKKRRGLANFFAGAAVFLAVATAAVVIILQNFG